MKGFQMGWLVVSTMLAVAQSQTPAPAPPVRSMVIAVSRDQSVLLGGVGGKDLAKDGTVQVEIMAYVTSTGEWSSHPCAQNYTKQCESFARQYLSKPHRYTVVSADGRGTEVLSMPVTLDECYDYTGVGTYPGASLHGTAIASDAPEFFAEGSAVTQVSPGDAAPIRNALRKFVPSKLDSLLELRLYRVELEGQQFIVAQRAYQDWASNPKYDTGQGALKMIFGIGKYEAGQFHLLHWKKNVEDLNEQIIGKVRLRSGKEFLITSLSDPESQTFHVYGIRDGKLAIVYAGGGSGC